MSSEHKLLWIIGSSSALEASKLPVAEASAVIERLTGVKLSRATLDRGARRQGQKAEVKRQELDEPMSRGAGADQQVKELRLNKPAEPFTFETFWRNGRWSWLFPHVPQDFDSSKN